MILGVLKFLYLKEELGHGQTWVNLYYFCLVLSITWSHPSVFYQLVEVSSQQMFDIFTLFIFLSLVRLTVGRYLFFLLYTQLFFLLHLSFLCLLFWRGDEESVFYLLILLFISSCEDLNSAIEFAFSVKKPSYFLKKPSYL